jgi:hypothetical protein
MLAGQAKKIQTATGFSRPLGQCLYKERYANAKARQPSRALTLVELAGTAPASARLSLLDFYRLILFINSWGLRIKTDKKHKPSNPHVLGSYYGS